MPEIYEDVTIKHFPELKRMEQVVPDNSMISDYKSCPRRYFFRYVLGFDVTKVQPYFSFGTGLHKFMETFEIAYAKHSQEYLKPMALALALSPAMTAVETFYKAETKKNPPEFGSKYDFMTWERLKQSCMEGYKWLEKEKLGGNISVLHTEQPFIVPISRFWYGGRMDELISWTGDLYIRDFKTTTKAEMYYKRGFKPNAQFTGYTYAASQLHGKQIKGVIVQVWFNTKTTGPKIVSYPVSFTREEIADWEQSTITWLERIEDSRNNDNYPKNESQCSFCPFHAVCSQPSERAQENVLKSQYAVRVWDHANPEGEN